jgi:hypothetical protein
LAKGLGFCFSPFTVHYSSRSDRTKRSYFFLLLASCSLLLSRSLSVIIRVIRGSLLLPASCFPLLATVFLPFPLPLQDAASGCRLTKQNHRAIEYCRRRNCRRRAEFRKFGFFCSLLTTHYSLRSPCRLAKQNHCALQYRRPIADVEGIGELKLTSHCSPPRKFPVLGLSPPWRVQPGETPLQDCPAPGRRPSVLSPEKASRSPLPVPAPVITCYFGESNPKLSIKSVCCAIGPCICPVFTGITVSE